jgi:hypothetical protein
MRAIGMVCVVVAAAGSTALGVINPFTEEFPGVASNWRNFNGSADLSPVLTGGPDGGSYGSGLFNFVAQANGATPVVIRGQDTYGTSGGAFFGDWIGAGVTQLSVYVRQNTGQALTFFARPAVSPAPGAIALAFNPVPSGVWTQLTFAINPSSPQFISFEGGDFNTVFSNVGRLQFGVVVPQALAGVDQNFVFDVDKVAIVPAPASLGLLGLGMVVLRRRR